MQYMNRCLENKTIYFVKCSHVGYRWYIILFKMLQCYIILLHFFQLAEYLHTGLRILARLLNRNYYYYYYYWVGAYIIYDMDMNMDSSFDALFNGRILNHTDLLRFVLFCFSNVRFYNIIHFLVIMLTFAPSLNIGSLCVNYNVVDGMVCYILENIYSLR